MSEAPGQLKRQIGVFHAVLLGLGSILGTGVFVSIGIAAGIAGPAVLVAIILAGLLALCNGLSSAQLAAAHPVAGGTYEYGYEFLHPKLGFTAGWMFLLAKSASAATALLAVGGLVLRGESMVTRNPFDTGRPRGQGLVHYLLERPLDYLPDSAVSLTVLLGCLIAVLVGLKRGSVVNAVLVFITLAGILIFSIYGAFILPLRCGYEHLFDMIGWHRADWGQLGWATAFMFVAYTGYGRIATLGEEVHDPRRSIPKAILWCLAITVGLYILAAAALLPIGRLPQVRNNPSGPLGYTSSLFFLSSTKTVLQPLLIIAAITAMVGVLFNLILGLSRVVLAMARRQDLPRRFSRLNLAGTSPGSAVLLVGVIIAAIASVGNIKATWSFAVFTVLIYYGITNLAALHLPIEHRLYPRFFAWAGLGGCLFLAWWVEPIYWIVGSGLIVVGLIWHSLAPWMFGVPPVPGETCEQCGYDLRASRDRCPECGKPILSPEDATRPA